MDDVSQRIAENLLRVQEQIAAAARAAGRSADEVTLVAVTKYVGIDEAAALVEAGCELLGESRPQQLWEKAAAPRLAAARWHLVGHLQRNKVERTLPLVELIHSIDTDRLLKAVDSAAGKRGVKARVLLEVNCSGDAAKHGFGPDELRRLTDHLDGYQHLQIDGLMTMAARIGGPGVARENFAALRKLRDELAPRLPRNICFHELSMGMSGDFAEAIAEGATIVRIGSALVEGIADNRDR